ncbi:contractile injection system protein, VgrG/Pvc8 family [Tritonibacter mobilis]|uniref:contractile injection system protein, VgrG/Pvc8 family n=1 Tax=Tritonibacter mobilis TaxID=379347 RepID=UPI000806E214|nr:contractile injection system protein, VgrG/Pvc8 family [Tritonibacter mobilis]
MGLIDFRPLFRVIVDGQDISNVLAPRLVSLRVTDGAGVQSDSVQITLSDTGYLAKIQEPRAGAEIKVWLGFPFSLSYMGLFIADTVEVTGPPDAVTITGTASVNGETTNGKTALTDQKKRSWPEGTTIGAMVDKIAGEHGFGAMVSESLHAEVLPHIDQIDESDINLLSRIARDFDAIAKPGNGRLIFTRRGESVTASGQPMPVVKVHKKALIEWRYRNSLRERVGRVIATTQDLKEGKPVDVEAGAGEPISRLKRRFPDKASAQRSADAELKRLGRAGRTLSLTMPGNPDAVAEARLQASGFRSYIDGEWLISRAVHSLDSGGYRTAITAEQI